MPKHQFPKPQSEDDAKASSEYLTRHAGVLSCISVDEEYRKSISERQLVANEDFQRGVGHPLFKGRKLRQHVDFDVEPLATS